MDIKELKEQGAKCRRLARDMTDKKAIAALLELAEGYDAKLTKMMAGPAAGQPPAPVVAPPSLSQSTPLTKPEAD